jgi:hypothetical protein
LRKSWFRAPKDLTIGDKGAPNDPMHPDVIMPQFSNELHGVGNDLLKSFWDFVEERVEMLLPEEKAARNNTLLFDMAMDRIIRELQNTVVNL